MRVRLREAARQGGLVALLVLASCASGTPQPRPIPLDGTESPEELRRVLRSLEGRADSEAWICRARVHERLRDADPSEAALHLARGDAADLEVLAGEGGPVLKGEAARRLQRHFRERADSPERCRLTFEGILGPPLRRYVMLTAAAFFCEYGSGGACAASIRLQAEAAEALAGSEALRPDCRSRWRERARALTARAEQPPADGGTGPEARRFCEDGAVRHLEEAQRAADAGTREKAARGKPEKVAEWYLRALTHYALAGECLGEPAAGRIHAFDGMGIVVRSLSHLLCRER